MTTNRNRLLFQALEQLAHFMEDHSTPENIRHNLDAITLMANANRVAHEPNSDFLKEVEAEAPTFVEFYERVMLRHIKEPINNGLDEE